MMTAKHEAAEDGSAAAPEVDAEDEDRDGDGGAVSGTSTGTATAASTLKVRRCSSSSLPSSWHHSMLPLRAAGAASRSESWCCLEKMRATRTSITVCCGVGAAAAADSPLEAGG